MIFDYSTNSSTSVLTILAETADTKSPSAVSNIFDATMFSIAVLISDSVISALGLSIENLLILSFGF